MATGTPLSFTMQFRNVDAGTVLFPFVMLMEMMCLIQMTLQINLSITLSPLLPPRLLTLLDISQI
jgi:hypothetical protein